MNLLAVMLIPDAERMGRYYDNWMGGLAMHMLGPPEVRLLINAFVVIVGFLILSGAVNTSIIGSNGVLSRVAEDGVLPDWFLKPHPRFGTTSRILYLIVGLQILTILYSGGDVILLGEAYAFGVVWSFVFKTLSMLVLRFRDKSTREYKVPGNVQIAGVEVPLGLGLIFAVVLLSALANLFTKPVATVSGAAFTVAFLVVFVVTEQCHQRLRRQHEHEHAGKHEHLEQFNREVVGQVDPAALKLTRPYRKLIAIRSTHNLYMLEKALADTDPETTDVVVMTAKPILPGADAARPGEIDHYDQQLMTAVVDRAERAGKRVIPMIVPTNTPLHAVLGTARQLGVQELVLGASNKFTAEEQLDQIAFYWINLHQGQPAPLTVRILSASRDLSFDLEGGNRIPKLADRQARSVAELRAAGIGIDRVLLLHDGTSAGSDLFEAVLTLLDPAVELDVAVLPDEGSSLQTHFAASPTTRLNFPARDRERAERLGRKIALQHLSDGSIAAVLKLAQARRNDLIVVPQPVEAVGAGPLSHAWLAELIHRAPCMVFAVSRPPVPQEVTEA
jgi:hypothetical protein